MSKIINQTNRTILLDEINPEKLDIITLIGDTKGMDSLSDDKIKEINEKLLVGSFEEFLEKFEPVVYSYFNANTQRVAYTLKKPEGYPEEMVTAINLNSNNDFLKMLMTLIESKRNQGSINVDFKFENLTDLISPKKVMDDIRQNRKELQYVYSEYSMMEDGDPRKLDTADKLNVMFEEASQNYNNVMAMLPLAIEDIKTRLLLGSEQSGENGNEQIALGVLSMGDDGELKILEAPKSESTSIVTVDDNVNTGLIAAIEDDYDAIAEDDANPYVRALVARTFCPLASTMVTEIDINKEVENYNNYLEFYKASKDDFIRVAKPLVEKILGIWSFFEQYPRKIKGRKPSLLILNTKNEMIAKTNNAIRMETFLNTVNGKNDFKNTIWYAIAPNIALAQASKGRLTRERFKGNAVTEKADVNTIEALASIMNILKDYKIQTFVSFEGNDKTTFNNMAIEGIEKFEDVCEPLINKPFSEYVIPCIPNFTVIPKDKSSVVLDNKMQINENNVAELSNAKSDVMKLWIEGVYIGAAYIAAGLVAAYQCPEYLKEKVKRNVDPYLPGVRFDIEAGENALKLPTTMAKEITGFTNSIKAEINKKSFGFVFSSENACLDGQNVTNITVYKARNLMTDYDGNFEPIYKTQVTTYIERVLRHTTNDFKEENIAAFFSPAPSSQKSQWLAKKTFINAVIGDGDDLNYTINEEEGTCNLDIAFNGNSRNLEVSINRV